MAPESCSGIYHIFCTGPSGRALPLAVTGSTTGASLRQLIQGALHVPSCEQVLVHQGRCLTDVTTLSSAGITRDSTIHVHLRLCGGKGGFGALLRGQGRDGKITDNFDACRDLSGRRVRHVEAEKKLKEWRADAQERQLEKLAMHHMKQMAKEAKRQKQHAGTVEEVKEEQRKAAAAVQDAINEALAAADSSGNSSQSGGAAAAAAVDGAAGDGETTAPTAAAAGSKRPAAAAAAKAGSSPAKRRKGGMMQVLDAVSSDEEDSDEDSDEDN